MTTTAFWGMTINNYDETDLALVQNGYPDHLREIVHTLEEGEEGTPHIQAWIKLQRQQRLSFVKKLFPRGHFKPLTSDEYVANTKVYAQKLDGTAMAAAVHKFNDPIHTLESVMKRVARKVVEARDQCWSKRTFESLDNIRREVEKDMVALDDYRYAKVFVSAAYKKVWIEFGVEMVIFFENQIRKEESANTHTHTHSEKKLSRQGGITDDATERDDASEGEDAEESGSEGQEDCEDYSEGSGSDDETDSEGGDYSVGEDSSGEED
ncbi:Rep [Chicken proventriculitis-associated circular virus 16]|nr:Rep [Chicken proventriculitis-associated circular virus 16]